MQPFFTKKNTQSFYLRHKAFSFFIKGLGVFILLCPAAAIADRPVPEKKPAVEPVSEAGFNVLDFTAALLDFSAPPVPARKPEFIPRALLNPVQKMLEKAARDKLSQEPISREDAKLYKAVFDMQAKGNLKAADESLQKIKDLRLLGHVLFQRYMHPKVYTSSFDELVTWLDLYNDHPGADRIYKLAVSRKPQNFNALIKLPKKSRGVARAEEPTMRLGKRYRSSRKRSQEEVQKLNALNRSVYKSIRVGEPSNAYESLQSGQNQLDTVEYDLLLGEIAAGYLYQGRVEQAQKLSGESVQRSGLHVVKAGWVAGLIAWQQQDYFRAARHFEIVARSTYASGWTAAAGAYWAARAHMRTGNVKAVSTWLKRGMSQPRTFYGLVATRSLGRDFDFNWSVPAFTKDYLEELSSLPAANRAIALVTAGQEGLAEAELIRIKPKTDKQYKALLAYAGYTNLPGLAMRLGAASSLSSDTFYDAALYPTGPWKPKEGFKIDPALVHAIMRQESRFDPMAKSPSGAKGLMQLMPATAKSVAGKKDAQLDHPETNLELGQRYLETLLDTDVVEGNLLYLLIAYNAGPGNLAKWKRRWPNVSDPLLFIELLPSSETRAYVERVLSNYWIYRLREGQDTPTLDAIAEGRPAQYGASL